jgi:hypothetical protein
MKLTMSEPETAALRSGTMRCINALNARVLLWWGHLPPLRHRLTSP